MNPNSLPNFSLLQTPAHNTNWMLRRCFTMRNGKNMTTTARIKLYQSKSRKWYKRPTFLTRKVVETLMRRKWLKGNVRFNSVDFCLTTILWAWLFNSSLSTPRLCSTKESRGCTPDCWEQQTSRRLTTCHTDDPESQELNLYDESGDESCPEVVRICKASGGACYEPANSTWSTEM